MTWDLTLPPGSEAISNGDNRIREFKTDVQTALQTYGSFPGSDPANPKYIWTISRGNTASRPASPVTGQMYNNTETKSLERYSGSAWEDVTALVDAATLAGAGLAGSGSVLSVNVDGTTIEINSDTLRIAASAAGNGLSGGGGSALSVNVDGTTIEISGDALRIAASAAGNGLGGGGGSALSVNVDDSSIEISGDSLRVKALGITESMLSSALVAKLGVDIGLVARGSATVSSSSNTDLVNISAHGRLRGTGNVITSGAGGVAKTTVTIDGTSHGEVTYGGSQAHLALDDDNANPTTMFKTAANFSALNELDTFFRTSLRVQVRSNGSESYNFIVQYERSA